MKKNRRSTVKHVPTEKSIDKVFKMARCGTPHKDIGLIMGMTDKTLRKHYRETLTTAQALSNSKVAGFLYDKAEGGNVTAQIFWLKTRAGWKELDDAMGRMEDIVKAMAIVRAGDELSDDDFEALGKKKKNK